MLIFFFFLFCRLEHAKMHAKHKGHEAMHAEMVLILIVTLVIAQLVLVQWKQRHPKSYNVSQFIFFFHTRFCTTWSTTNLVFFTGCLFLFVCLPFCIINSESSIFTEMWNIAHYMHSTVAAFSQALMLDEKPF